MVCILEEKELMRRIKNILGPGKNLKGFEEVTQVTCCHHSVMKVKSKL